MNYINIDQMPAIRTRRQKTSLKLWAGITLAMIGYLYLITAKFGFTTPLLISDNNEIIAGHGRLLAIKELNWQKVPCVLNYAF